MGGASAAPARSASSPSRPSPTRATSRPTCSLDVVGLDEVAEVLRIVGCSPATVVGRGIEDAAARTAGITNTVTAADLGLVMAAVGRREPALGGDQVLAPVEAMLARQVHVDQVPAGLPPGTPTASKSGWIPGVSHDVALVRPARRGAVRPRRLHDRRPRRDRGRRLRRRHRPGRLASRAPGGGGAAMTTIERVDDDDLVRAAAHAVRHRAAPHRDDRHRGRHHHRQRRPHRLGRGAAGVAGDGGVARERHCLHRGDARPGRHRPARSTTGTTSRPRQPSSSAPWPATSVPRPRSTRPCTTSSPRRRAPRSPRSSRPGRTAYATC